MFKAETELCGLPCLAINNSKIPKQCKFHSATPKKNSSLTPDILILAKQ